MTVKTIIFTGSEISKSFLFECAKFYASKGYYVCYISRREHTSLPVPIVVRTTDDETITLPDVYTFALMTFLTLPTPSNLTDYLLDVHRLSPSSSEIPKMLIIERLDDYFDLLKDEENKETQDDSFDFVCACLHDASNYLSKYYRRGSDNTADNYDSVVYLILSFGDNITFTDKFEHICKTLFVSPIVWTINESDRECGKKFIVDDDKSLVFRNFSRPSKYVFSLEEDRLIYEKKNDISSSDDISTGYMFLV